MLGCRCRRTSASEASVASKRRLLDFRTSPPVTCMLRGCFLLFSISLLLKLTESRYSKSVPYLLSLLTTPTKCPEQRQAKGRPGASGASRRPWAPVRLLFLVLAPSSPFALSRLQKLSNAKDADSGSLSPERRGWPVREKRGPGAVPLSLSACGASHFVPCSQPLHFRRLPLPLRSLTLSSPAPRPPTLLDHALARRTRWTARPR